MAENLLGTENHVLRQLGLLDDLAIDPCCKLSALRSCLVSLLADQNRAHGSEIVKPFGKEILASRISFKLEHAARQIVADSVPQNVGSRLGLADILCFFRRNKHQFALVIQQTGGAKLIYGNVFVGAGQSPRRLDPQCWVTRLCQLLMRSVGVDIIPLLRSSSPWLPSHAIESSRRHSKLGCWFERSAPATTALSISLVL